MPSDPSGKPTQGWRQQVTKAKRNGDALPEWRKEPVAPTSQPRPSRKRLKLFLVGAAAAAVLGFFLWLIVRPDPPGHSAFVLVGAGYEENVAVPHNVYGREGLKALVEWTAGYKKPFLLWGGEIPRLHHQTLEFRSTNRWDKDLDKFGEQTIMVYFALHGGVDGKGAYLLPHDADPHNPAESRLYLEDILGRLRQLPEEKNKVLILDATQATADWSRGMLHNDFARALENLDEHIAKVPNLIVISASDTDQKSWVAEPWRKTIFGHHVVEGLKGAADDRREGGDGNELVTAQELMAYLRKNVERWVRDNRAALQTPVLLPKKDGDQRAGKIDLAQVRDGYQAPDPKPLSALPLQLKQAWEDYQRLDGLVPSPAVYAPQQWRHYQTTLLRYEQLLRAGAPEAAAKVGGKLQSLESELTRGQVLELSSMQNTLAMPAAAGAPTFTPDDKFRSQFQLLWDAPKEEQSQRWRQFNQQYGAQMPVAAPVSGKVRGQLVRVRVHDRLLELVAEDPEKNFKKAHELLQVVDDPVSPRPAEINYLAVVYRILNQDLAGNPPDKKFPVEFREALKAALRVRRLAERAALGLQTGDHPYSEQVHRWVQMQVETADELRARGQDLLFRSDRDKLRESLRLLEDAEREYQVAQGNAQLVQQALTVRDRAQADLFFYSQWLAQRRLTDDDPGRRKLTRQVQLAEELWENLHRLSETLEKPNPKGIDQLRDQTEGASRAFNQLRSDFDEHCSGLSKAAHPTTPRDHDDVLLVPMNNAKSRMDLLNRNRLIGHQLLVETAQRMGEIPSIPLEQNQAWAKDAAQRQGRMALAVLGSRWFNETPGTDVVPYRTMKDLLDPETFPNRQRWWEDLAKVGAQVGRRWQQLPVALNQEADNWRKATGKQAMEVLPKADRLARLLDGTASLPASFHPTQEYRLALTRDLLLWQADRTVKEHYYSEKPDAEPYYLVAGRGYREDVLRLDSRKHHAEAAEALIVRLKEERLVVDGPADLHWTSEQRLDFPFYLRPDRDAWVPPGHAVVWVETDGTLLRPTHPEAAASSDWNVGVKPERVGPISLTLESPYLQAAQKTPPSTLDLRSTTVTLRGVYRGQRIEQKAQVDLHPLADTIRVQYPPPDRGSLAVRAHPDIHTRFAPSKGRIVIVLDFSGSMAVRVDGKSGENPASEFRWDGPETRLHQAVDTLEQVLRELEPGVTVSLWIFGHHKGGEGAIKPLLKNMQLDKDKKTEQINSLIKQVKEEKPWYGTPLLRAMKVAKGDLDKKTDDGKDFDGFKTMVVITDGADSEYKDKPKEIPPLLEKLFRDSGIQLNLVMFDVKNDKGTMEEQFGVIKSKDWPLQGRIHDAKDKDNLAQHLRAAMRQQLRYWLETAGGAPVSEDPAKQTEYDISRSGSDDQWFPGGLKPGGYRLRVKANKDLYKHVDLSRGELLLANLVPTPTGEIGFQRVFVSKTDYGHRPFAEDSGKKWRLSALQNQLLTGGAMLMLLGLEKEPEASAPKDTLEFVRLDEAWVEVKPHGSDARIAQRWAYVTGYPLPTYGADVAAWPNAPGSSMPAKPDARVWFSADRERLPPVVLRRDPDFKTLDALQNRVVQVDGHDVLIESVRVERHWVRARPDKEPEQQECLVVRLKVTDNPADKTRDPRVWVQIEGLDPRGQEHRFYGEAGKYTGLFWSVNQDQLREKLSGLRLTAVAAFKRDAEKKGFTIRLQDLQAPGANDVRPPAIELQ